MLKSLTNRFSRIIVGALTLCTLSIMVSGPAYAPPKVKRPLSATAAASTSASSTSARPTKPTLIASKNTPSRVTGTRAPRKTPSRATLVASAAAGTNFRLEKMNTAKDVAEVAENLVDNVVPGLLDDKDPNLPKLRAEITRLIDSIKARKPAEAAALEARKTVLKDLVKNLKANTPGTRDESKKFEQFFAGLVSDGETLTDLPLFEQGTSAEGRIKPILSVAERTYAGEDGRLLQLSHQISLQLYFHANENKVADPNRQTSEVQTMFLGNDVYIATNSPTTITDLQRLMKNNEGLVGLLSTLPGKGSPLRNIVDDSAKKNGKGRPTAFDEVTRIQRTFNKLRELGTGERQGDTAEFAEAVRLMDVIKAAGQPKVIAVDHDNAGKVSGWTMPDRSNTGRVFLVTNDSVDEHHAELSLIRVLDRALAEHNKAGKPMPTAYLAGKKRACTTCMGNIVDAISRGHDLRVSYHSGMVWQNQAKVSSVRANLLSAFLALAQPHFHTPATEDRKRFSKVVAGVDDDSDSEPADTEIYAEIRDSSRKTNSDDDDNDSDDNDSVEDTTTASTADTRTKRRRTGKSK